MHKGKTFLIAMLISSMYVGANTQNCGTVNINQILTGPRHQAMLRVSNNDCGKNGYVCIDLTETYYSKSIADATYSFALAKHISGEKVSITVSTESQGCGYDAPIINDIRSE